MEVIIKPTGRCNFNCTFCSAGMMDDVIEHPKDGHVPEKLKEFLSLAEPTNIIITGGDPLMIDPGYYYELYDLFKVPIGATTNLKDFYLHPEKWKDLFNEGWFNIATSFNYGNARRWDKDTVYDEQMFLKVIDKFQEYCPGKGIPMFLAVIDNNNEDMIMDHVYLAKRLNTQVKLNAAIACGRQKDSFPRYKIFKTYIDIIEADLEQYEVYCSDRKHNRCPRNTDLNCISTIRCCYIDNHGDIHVATCDEQLSMGHELDKKDWIPECYYQEKIDKSEFISKKCAYCELFRLCNGCRTNREMAKLFPEYCDEMKKLEEKIIEYGWLL